MAITITHGNQPNGKESTENQQQNQEQQQQSQQAPQQQEEIHVLTPEELNRRLMYQSAKDMFFSADMIKEYRIDEAIKEHYLNKKHFSLRSKQAYADILRTSKPTTKYLLPGQIVLFEYLEPKYKEELEYYDRTPLTLFCGITRTKDGNIREVGFNLHYYPPFARAKILNTVYEVFKAYYKNYFNESPSKPNMFISYNALKALCNKHNKIAFGIKMYIPSLRSRSYVIPTRMIATASFTEGHFSKATRAMIMQYWRHFKP